MQKNVNLTSSDPVIFAKCVACDRHGRGRKVGNYFGSSYTARRWRQDPVCENCSGPMTFLFEVKVDD